MIHFLYVWMGLSNASGPQYLFWSGIFGDATIFFSVIYGFRTWRKRNECHEETCHKHGKYEFYDQINNVKYKLCELHHPGVPSQLHHMHFVGIHKQQTSGFKKH